MGAIQSPVPYVPASGGSISSTSAPAFTVNTTSVGAFITLVNFLASSMTAGQAVIFNLGQSATTRNAASWSFNYIGAGSTSNSMTFNFFGSAVYFSVTAGGVVTTANNTLDDGAGNVTAIGSVRPGNGASAGGHMYSGSGAPNIAGSVAGDYYFRTDTPSTANQRIYVATAANTWSGIV